MVSKDRVRALVGRGSRVVALAMLLVLTAGCVDLSKPDTMAVVGVITVVGLLVFLFVVKVMRGQAARRRGRGSGCGAIGGCGFDTGGMHGIGSHGGHGHGHDHGGDAGDSGGGGDGGGGGCGGGGCGGGGD